MDPITHARCVEGGHFLICYVSVLLKRPVRVKVLNNRFCIENVMGLARGFCALEQHGTTSPQVTGLLDS